MVPKVAGKGKSFKGAGAYYLHDKGASTSERVAFAETIGLPTSDPDMAIRLMAHTAMNQNAIKARAGGKAQGRKLRDPVYAYSLAWAPDESPTPEAMKAAARETLTRLGLDGHEAILIAHNDEPHPHIHVIVNRVHPETGIAAKLSCDHLILSKWAEAYEQAQGKIRCEQRVENNRQRQALKEQAQAAFVKDRQSRNAAEYHRWRSLRIKEEFERRQAESRKLSQAQKTRRDQLNAAKEKVIEQRRQWIRENTKRHWRAVFLSQKREREKKELEQATALSRLRIFLKERTRQLFQADRQTRTGFLSGAFQAAVGGTTELQKLDEKHKAERKALAAKIKDVERQAINDTNREFRERLEQLRETERRERAEMALRHSAESQQTAADIASGKMERLYEAQKDMGQQFDQASYGEPLPPDAARLSEPFRKAAISQDQRQEETRRAFRENMDDVTKAPERDPHHDDEDTRKAERTDEERDDDDDDRKSGDSRSLKDRLTGRFKKATQTTRDKFRENMDDITRDKGREREIDPPKPPAPPKKNGPEGPKF